MCSWNVIPKIRSEVVTIRPWMALGKARPCPVWGQSHCSGRRAEGSPVLRAKTGIQLKISALEGRSMGGTQR